MERFYGFDLGDAESAVARLEKPAGSVPEMLTAAGQESFVTAVAVRPGGELLIGEQACYADDAVRRRIRFKSRFLTDPSVRADVKSFAAGVLGELYGSGDLVRNADVAFSVGCPAGWDRQTREVYRSLFEQAGYPPLKIVSESRAAMVAACQSRHLQVGYDILSRPVLVADIGSSTTDFAYIVNGHEAEMRTAGEVALGGGLMDEMLLQAAVAASPDAEEIRRVFAESGAWQTYCEFAARRLKEAWFSQETEEPLARTVLIRYDRPLRLKLSMDKDQARRLTDGPCEALSGRSFREVFSESLRRVRGAIRGELPELLFLTGGVSRMPAVREWCAEVFPEAVVITGTEPQFSVAKGLAWCGRVDEDMREFRAELADLAAGRGVEDIVKDHIRDLYRLAVKALADPLIEEAAAPVFERWRSGQIRRLSDTDEELTAAITAYLQSDAAREKLAGPVTVWLRPVAEELEELTMPLCVRHGIPYSALSLTPLLGTSDIEFRLEAKNIFAVEEFTWIFDSLISVIVGLLCGGGGIALISSGPAGILAGAFASFALLALGRKKFESLILEADLPSWMRKLVHAGAVRSRRESLAESLRDSFYETLNEEKSAQMLARMSDEISGQIEQALTRMAEIVEIPLG